MNPGDAVLVLVDEDVFSSPIDRDTAWIVDSVDDFDSTVWITNDGKTFRNVRLQDVIPADEQVTARKLIALWKRGNRLVTASRSENWAQIIQWTNQMNTLVEQLEAEVNGNG